MSTTSEKKAKTAREALLMAAELLSKRGAWCKGTFARTAKHVAVDPLAENAVSFCAFGAIKRVAKGRIQDRAIDRLYEAIYPARTIGPWNDSQKSKRPVIAALRKAADL